MKLEPPDHPALWQPGREFTAEDRELHGKTTIPAMLKAVADVGAAGLSFSHIGLSLRGFVTKYAGWEVCLNPSFAQVGDQFISKPEKCLSQLSYSTYVRRPAQIRAVFEDLDGVRHELALEGMDARVFMHLENLTRGLPIFPRPKAVVG